MKITLTKDVLVGPADVQATRAGTVVDLDDATAKEFIANGLATEATAAAKKSPEHEAKQAHEPENKMAHAPANKKA